MKRYGGVLRLRPERVAEYVELHRAVWPEVLATLSRCNVHNYSIFLRELDDGRTYLFSYFEHDGADFAADMATIAADPATQCWWKLTEPCQEPLASRAPGEWWASMREVFHLD